MSTMTHVEYTDPAIMIPGMTDGLNSWMPLSDDQRTGWACIACGRNTSGMRPVGSCDEGQVFLCAACHELWASDVPTSASSSRKTDFFEVFAKMSEDAAEGMRARKVVPQDLACRCLFDEDADPIAVDGTRCPFPEHSADAAKHWHATWGRQYVNQPMSWPGESETIGFAAAALHHASHLHAVSCRTREDCDGPDSHEYAAAEVIVKALRDRAWYGDPTGGPIRG